MVIMRQWVPFPTLWIEDGGLKDFTWKSGGPDVLAAFICMVLLAHHRGDGGAARLTYDSIDAVAGLSRAKIAAGLEILTKSGLAERVDRSTFLLPTLDPTQRGWGKLPAKKLYNSHGGIPMFKDFTLRKRSELDAMKLYLLFVARRDNETNRVDLSYDKITEYSGIARQHITSALTILSVNGWLVVDRQQSDLNEFATANSYRLRYLEPYRHAGTTGRAEIDARTRALREMIS
ncbi:hypothetical protein [Mesorhizobium sp. M0213]|uniref:hypothetical protein n=1 Tax=unclassified Mesorhizobium TaxID=325217 RepID=UPI00333560B0